MNNRRSFILALAVTVALCSAAAGAEGFRLNLERPGEREFVRDLAALITEPDQQKIRGIADKLLRDKATPIIVVTIKSMTEHGGEGLRIETFARLLFDQWGIGHAQVNGRNWNTGILLLVSRNDRKARIELGAGWGLGKDAQCQRIMNDQIIYHFKRNEFSRGILAGVEALDCMARELQLPSRPQPSPAPASQSGGWLPSGCLCSFLPCIAIMLPIIFIAKLASFMLRGWTGWGLRASRGWGRRRSSWWSGFGASSSSWSSGSSSFSGGSFGGGFSGGGGASGSW
jgi:uncharacterized protein